MDAPSNLIEVTAATLREEDEFYEQTRTRLIGPCRVDRIERGQITYERPDGFFYPMHQRMTVKVAA